MDPYRYLPFISRKVKQAWAERQLPPQHESWTPMTKPLSQCRVALISTAEVALLDDEPFDQQGERDHPWRGDPSWRALPLEATEAPKRSPSPATRHYRMPLEGPKSGGPIPADAEILKVRASRHRDDPAPRKS